jgi:hypothetical protein
VSVYSRYACAAAVGLWVTQLLPGQERGQWDVPTASAIQQAQGVEAPNFNAISQATPPAAVPPAVDNLPSGAPPVEPMPIFQAAPSPYDLNPPKMPNYAWPTYAPYNNYSRVAYPTQYPYQSWPFIGPNYPFPKIPPNWRKVSLEWQDGYWWYGPHSNSHDWWRLRYW